MSTPTGPTDAAEVPAATRARTPGWRDPRLWIGILVVTGSVVLGVRVVGAADESVSVWSVTEDLAVGDTVTSEDLVARQVRFVDEGDLERYLPADDTLPADLQLSRAVGEGELLPRAALGDDGEAGLREVPFGIADSDIPPSVAPGSLVDVVVATPGDGSRGRAETVLADVVVLEVADSSADVGAGAERQVVVGVAEDQVAGVPDALGVASTGTVSLVGVG